MMAPHLGDLLAPWSIITINIIILDMYSMSEQNFRARYDLNIQKGFSTQAPISFTGNGFVTPRHGPALVCSWTKKDVALKGSVTFVTKAFIPSGI